MAQPAPWTAQYEPGVPTSVPVPPGTFHGILEAAASGAPTLPALEFYGRRQSFADLAAAVERVAATLRQQPGFGPGARVLLDLPNGCHLVQAVLGTLKAGGVLVPVGGLDPSARARVVASTQPVAAFVAADRAAGVAPDLDPVACPLIVADPVTDLPAMLRLLARARRRPPPLPTAATRWQDWLPRKVPPGELGDPPPAGAPALAMPTADGQHCATYSHRQLVAGATLIRAWLTDAFLGDETWLVLADLASPLGLAAIVGTALGMRAQVVLLPRWTGQDALDALRYVRPSYVLCDADTVRRLVAEPNLSRLGLESTRAIVVGEPLHESVARAFTEATGDDLCVGYAPEGMAGLATCNPINGRRVAGSIGLPLPGVAARVTAPDGRHTRVDETGVLELAGPHGPPGWLRTGLLARLDAQGFVHAAGLPGRPDRPISKVTREADSVPREADSVTLGRS